ncbi:TRAP transporter small permease [Psychrobacillus sp. FSL H8-0483]|uniref:TRAP transporter small permease n=1 Tax=Psychrobacillus sp. FSL H8-0483 TaxID=2921389 RepID=UPI00315AB7C9
MSVDRVLKRLEEWIVVLVMSIMSLIAFANILSRGLVGYSLSFTEEITINLFVFLTFVGTAIGVRQNAHLGFTLIYDRANGVFKKGITLLVGVLMGGLFLVLVYFGLQMMLYQMELGQKTPSLGWPQWLFSLAMPLGALLCLYRTVQVTIMELREESLQGGESV